MTLANDHYTYRITWSQADHEHLALCAEFPGLSWLDATPEAALAGIRRLVTEVIADLKASKEPIPEPLATHQYTGKFVVRVPPEVHRRLAMEAAEARISLNRLVSAKLSQ